MIPQELNDRLLELDGGCVHEWQEYRRDVCTDRWQLSQNKCAKCGDYRTISHMLQRDGRITPEDKLPAVGDGRTLTLGEVVRLWAKLKGDVEPIVNIQWGIRGQWWVEVIGEYDSEAHAIADTPEAALAAAILAAVDGERA